MMDAEELEIFEKVQESLRQIRVVMVQLAVGIEALENCMKHLGDAMKPEPKIHMKHLGDVMKPELKICKLPKCGQPEDAPIHKIAHKLFHPFWN